MVQAQITESPYKSVPVSSSSYDGFSSMTPIRPAPVASPADDDNFEAVQRANEAAIQSMFKDKNTGGKNRIIKQSNTMDLQEEMINM